MNRLLNEKSRLFANADPYAVSDYVNQHVGSHCIRLPKSGRPAASLSHRSFGSLDLCRISYGGSVRVTSPALETIYHLQVLLQGHCLWRGHGQEHYFTPGELLLINPDDPVDLTYSDDCEKFIVKLPARLIERACSDNHWQSPSDGVRFASRHQLQQLDGFASLLGLVCDEAESEQSLPLVQEHYTRIIATKLLGLLSNNVSRQELAESSPSFERLVQFIDDNLKQDISLEQLAQLAHMSPRSLYALFDKHLGTTPKHYIRQRKLERVRACLSDPVARVRNVTEVALDYGFLHLGRFSESYRSAFGELPSDTLRRRES
ncbi:AraC family transcriptional regulator [Pseudomonas sp. ALS1279]|jgi:AraC-like DNA-binding protein|uniref:Transcriptional regulator, AraC family n=1 Tax=Pseudomonas sihuiensis TaxID=1274359 RepID=A0A1H2MB52_9PSED|nr:MULTISPECIES: AraC family transcriptional regulator [Pseudomonas]TRO43336.1 AraC family transcriptional regulator [Pseudomonas sp. ALS1279]SDU90477.1 transcriptional regulator, AraC family [Pseudomonas sihuiensis]